VHLITGALGSEHALVGRELALDPDAHAALSTQPVSRARKLLYLLTHCRLEERGFTPADRASML